MDDASRTYSYAIIDSLLPVANYRSKIKVTGAGDNSTVEWSSEFDPKGVAEGEAADVVHGIYQAGFDNLQKMFGGRRRNSGPRCTAPTAEEASPTPPL